MLTTRDSPGLRARTGKGQHVETSLTNASIAMQAADFIDYPGMKREYPGDKDIKGLNATHRHYRTRDKRWIFLFCPREAHWQNLCRAMGLENLLSDPRFQTSGDRRENDDALVTILGNAFQAGTSDEWLALLPQADTPIALGQTMAELMKAPHCQENAIIDEREHKDFGRVRLVGVGPRFSDMSGIIRRPAPALGEHTEEVLVELGYGKEQIADLKAKRIIHTPNESEG